MKKFALDFLLCFKFIALMLMVQMLFGVVSAEQTVHCVTVCTSEVDGISSIGEFQYTADGIIFTCTDPGMETYIRYDFGGHVVEKWYYSDGVVEKVSYYLYNEAGMLIEERELCDGEYHGGSRYTYDEENRLILHEYLGADGENRGTYERVYDDAGNLIRVGRPADSNSQYRTEYFYDSNNYLVREESYDNDGKLKYYYVYTNNADGKLIRQDVYAGEGNVSGYEGFEGYFDFTYDDAGRLTGEIWHQEYKSYSTYISKYYTYDENGKLIRYWDVGFDLNTDIEYQYDEQGYLVAMLDQLEGYSVYLQYEDLILDDTIAKAADTWSREGILSNYQ